MLHYFSKSRKYHSNYENSSSGSVKDKIIKSLLEREFKLTKLKIKLGEGSERPFTISELSNCDRGITNLVFMVLKNYKKMLLSNKYFDCPCGKLVTAAYTHFGYN